jgi:uncharacterized protein YrrD
MYFNFQELRGYSLVGTDGEIGSIKDMYFDDQSWAIRYLIADTGSWLSSHKVLISPHAIDRLDRGARHLYLRLTRKQIADGPLISSELPVSRQFEIDYYENFGFPFYWQGGGLWGASAMPKVELAGSSTQYDHKSREMENGDLHLRSIHAVHGYRLKASDGEIGHVIDFLIDETIWSIQHVLVKIIILVSGKEIWIPIDRIKHILYRESLMITDMTIEEIQQRPTWYPLEVAHHQ